jgi:hypothetical protein
LFSYLKKHAKIIDKYLSNPLSSYYETVGQDIIKFHDEEAEDPEWKVRPSTCTLLLLP